MKADHAPLWLGIDLGTRGVRALAVSAEGRIAGRGALPLDSLRAGARHEQNPEQWWHALVGAVRAALAGVGAERVEAVAIAGTSGTILLVDGAGAPLTPALMYDDMRAAAGGDGRTLGTSLRDEPSLARMPPQWGLPKLLWMLEHWPGRARGARLAHQPDFVAHRLCGQQPATDWSHALKTGYDLVEDRWPPELTAALGVPAGMLPPVVHSGAPLGAVDEDGARATGLLAGTPVIAGMTDGCAAQLAAGALSEGDWSSVLGSTLVLKGVSPTLLEDPAGVLYSHRAPGGGWLPGGASSTGAAVLAARFPARDLDELGERAAAHERTDVLAYPLLSRGERFPFAAADAEGFMVGRPVDDSEHFAALLQGLAYVERLCLDFVALLGARTDGTVSLTGGATRGRYLCQLRADVLQRPLRVPETPEPALGMAMLAAAADRPPGATVAAMARTREVYEPRDDRAEGFLESYARLVAELEGRGWLGTELADHARARL